MGGSSSKEESSGQRPSYGSQPHQPQSNYPPYYPAPTQQYYLQPPVHRPYEQQQSFVNPVPPRVNKTLDRKYSRIADNYSSLEQATEALARAGLESSNLIVGIDFTRATNGLVNCSS